MDREELEKIFEQEKARILEMFGAADLTKAEQQAEALINKHLHGYSGVISHGNWSKLRKDIASLIEKAFA